MVKEHRAPEGRHLLNGGAAGVQPPAHVCLERQIELCRPAGARNYFCRLPRADALGYPLDAPPALCHVITAIWIALESHLEFLETYFSAYPEKAQRPRVVKSGRTKSHKVRLYPRTSFDRTVHHHKRTTTFFCP